MRVRESKGSPLFLYGYIDFSVHMLYYARSCLSENDTGDNGTEGVGRG